MKRFFHKILAFTLTLAVLFSTTAFTADMHFCCDKLVDLAVFSKVKSCNEKVKQQDEKPTKECSLGQKGCCSNQTFVKQGEDNLKSVSFELDANNVIFLKVFFYSYVNLFQGLELKTVPFINYDPPWIEKDILVLHETFLI
ncbi:hypothetical protein PP182_09510 [Maribacter sp. PR1]|uniref:Secreted protein n=1 Tax=Maribacter cobaltidurans TaxID=1178778 RepID=A0ABU7ITT1_9FLAO|nr:MULTISPECIES: hypothetical protein [Maribacter]MDC6388916.1 hypothetical protein [Maribacter sp. PR1]MEE1976304.1 hypothetical protein [Maribacter cobaltidurans]|tara:strand:- start:1896 stop:2318 length:423 start_codon:yes stop_codon:yes gene_type:complete